MTDLLLAADDAFRFENGIHAFILLDSFTLHVIQLHQHLVIRLSLRKKRGKREKVVYQQQWREEKEGNVP